MAKRRHLVALIAMSFGGLAAALPTSADEPMHSAPLHSQITHVQPLTGIVFWEDSGKNKTDAIQLEYSYMKYGDIVREKGIYDWSPLETKLTAIAKRKHQAVIRFYDTYVAEETTVPAYIKALPDYHEVHALAERKQTGFTDWSNSEWKRFVFEFYQRYAEKYDRDPRLAYVEAGFGLWAEYHLYEGPGEKLGQTFPDKAYQASFIRHLATHFKQTPFLISVDAADEERAPFANDYALRGERFGVFDDSFLCKQHPKENEPNWNVFGRDRYLKAPAGGEFSYYNKNDQREALSAAGPNGVPFEQAAKAFHITFMIGSDQPKYQPMDRIRQAGMACGYRFAIEALEVGAGRSRMTVTNRGVAPIYYDAFVAVNGVRSLTSLKGLAPGKQLTCEVAAGGASPKVTIECDRLVAGQEIQFEADLK